MRMKIKDQIVPASEVLRIIDQRLEAVTTQYYYAKGNDRKIEAEAMAETKWQIAEMKMQLVDYLTENLNKG